MSEKDMPKQLSVDIETLSIKQELNIRNLKGETSAERGRILVRAGLKFPFTVNNVYAICVNGVWYEKSLRPDLHDELWEVLK